MKLDRQIRWLSGPWRPRPWPDPTPRVLAGADDAVITRRKACLLLRGTPRQAVAMMDAMDYDVHLFTDAETGEDAVVYRAGPSGLRLARQCSMRHPAMSDTAASPPLQLTVNPHHTPILTEAAALCRLRDHGLPFLFFTDQATGRSRLLYLRYDANLGLITPSVTPTKTRPSVRRRMSEPLREEEHTFRISALCQLKVQILEVVRGPQAALRMLPPRNGVCSAADAETLEPRRRSGHQFHSASWQLKVGRQQAGDGVVGLAVDRRLADVDCHLTVGTDLDKGPLAAAGLDLNDDGVGHVA
jgi:hypothetical protein